MKKIIKVDYIFDMGELADKLGIPGEIVDIDMLNDKRIRITAREG